MSGMQKTHMQSTDDFGRPLVERYEQRVMTWCTGGPSGGSVHQPPGPDWRVVGFGMAGDGRSTYATIVYERTYFEHVK